MILNNKLKKVKIIKEMAISNDSNIVKKDNKVQTESLKEMEMNMEMSMPMPMPMPISNKKRKIMDKKKKKIMKDDLVYMNALPDSELYEKSYMHRDHISHVLFTPYTQFLITASKDGHIKFWKKMLMGIEFVKHYKAHLEPIIGLDVTEDGLRLCSSSTDQFIKFYDILSFDMIHFIKLKDYIPSIIAWAYKKETNVIPKIAVADMNKPIIRIYNADFINNDKPIYIIDKIHSVPIFAMKFNSFYNIMISSDAKGMIEYWDIDTYSFPSDNIILKFKYKSETSLYDIAKNKTAATYISINPINGNDFIICTLNQQIRIFNFLTGKLRRIYDESLIIYEDAQADKTLKLDSIDFGKRSAVERELDSFVKKNLYNDNNNDKNIQSFPARHYICNCIYDKSGQYIIYSCLIGIKIVHIETNRCVKILGKVENTERFLQICLFQEIPNINSQYQKYATNDSKSKKSIIMSDQNDKNSIGKQIDPLIICNSFKKNRFYIFSRREPSIDLNDENEEGRDIFNEKPTLEETQIATEMVPNVILGKEAIIHTTKGDIFIKLFPNETPKTNENFCVHAKNGYYDNLLFHRVIKNFMIQTGDPLGDGTGGESIWGGEFQDEFHRSLRHDRSFTLSMANAGPNTNGSQFFITTVPTPWLDNKHTVFGRVEKGMDTVNEIEKTKTNKYDKPLEDIRIINIDITTI